jgi:oligoribonuclease NrnB/cAMP/cGMP phosphodiesterase (DHH superfamily)
MICIYHSKDLDGWMSAAIVKKRYPDCKLIGWTYGESVPKEIAELEPDSDIVMVDISFPLDHMIGIDQSYQLTWIDHHDRTIKEAEAYFLECGLIPPIGERNPKFAACELTWQYFFPDDPMPELVRLLGRYDCFGHKGTPEEKKVLYFQYGARQVISNPTDALAYLNEYLTSEYNAQAQIEVILSAGATIYNYLCTEAKQIYKNRFVQLFSDMVGGPTYRFAMVNKERFNPINFGIDYHKDGYDGFCSFWFENGKWIYSLYNDNGLVDCSAIAKAHGGGGHKGASGFQSENAQYFPYFHQSQPPIGYER